MTKLYLLLLATTTLMLGGISVAKADTSRVELRGTFICGSSLIGSDTKEFADFASLTVDGKNASWLRSNAVIDETAKGTVDENGNVTLVGTGLRKDGKGPTWVIRLVGKFKNTRFEGKGGTESADGKVRYRECSVFMDSPLRTTLNFVEKGGLDSTIYKLETAIFQPEKPNGRVVIFSHGSTGGNPNGIKISYSYIAPAVARMLVDNGYTVVMWMRKGRGNSEGRFTEESRSCDVGKLNIETQEAYDQIGQIITQLKERFGVKKVILIGHSRGGFLSATYAAAHPEDISHVVNLAGAWSAACEQRTRFNRDKFQGAAKTFQKQYWVYAVDDTYFIKDKFDDAEYRWLSSVARENKIEFRQIGNGGFADGHLAPLYKPNLWEVEVVQWLND